MKKLNININSIVILFLTKHPKNRDTGKIEVLTIIIWKYATEMVWRFDSVFWLNFDHFLCGILSFNFLFLFLLLLFLRLF